MASVSMNKVGFECEFVTKPSKEFPQSECPVCLHILREPYQVTCCGKSFCKECIKRVKDGGKPCPCCNEGEIKDFPNKGLQQPLYGFQVYCSKKDSGCEWKGEMGQLDRHLNVSQTTPENELEGCEYSDIECTFCQDFFVRSELRHHKTDLCDKRPFSCEHCNDFESTYEDVIHNHWPVCGHHPVKCPNECGAVPLRHDMKSHVEKDCPLTVVECDFNYVGCQVRLLRKNVPDHLKDYLAMHVSLLAICHKKQQNEIVQLRRQHEHEVKELKERLQDKVNKLQGEIIKLKSQVSTIPVHFMVQGVSQYGMISPSKMKKWVSPHFYSHWNGYKLCLHVYAGEAITSVVNKGELEFINVPCIKFNCYLLPGENDAQLNWPLRGAITIIISGQPKQAENPSRSLIPAKICYAAVQSNHSVHEVDGVACGGAFIEFKDIQQLLVNDCLNLQLASWV